MLEVRALQTGYAGVEVLHGIDLRVDEGETVCLLGSNGAGKTTTLRAIMRQLPVAAGSIAFLGNDLRGLRGFEPAHLGMGYVPEGRGMLASLSVRENLELGAFTPRARPAFAQNLEQVLALFPALTSRLGEPAANLSGGQQQMLAIGRALMGSPRLLILDEPSLGLSPQIIAQVYAVLGKLRATGQSILLVEQTVGRALNLCDRAYVLEQGRVAVSGDRESVRANPRVRDAYLGL
jgi:branched-chain amino acid transport system ATP-binding protein